MKQTDANKTLALAGIFQAAHLVNTLAFEGEVNKRAYETSLNSIFEMTVPDVVSVFKGSEGVRIGLSYVIRYGTKKPPFHEKLLMRYLLYMTELGKKVLKNPLLFRHIERRLQPIVSQVTHLGLTHDIVIQELAALYRQVFLGRRLQVPVRGKLTLLKNTHIVNSIYALLLAGIRSAVLWYQVGGNRWQLFFLRRKLRENADFLLRHPCHD